MAGAAEQKSAYFLDLEDDEEALRVAQDVASALQWVRDDPRRRGSVVAGVELADIFARRH